MPNSLPPTNEDLAAVAELMPMPVYHVVAFPTVVSVIARRAGWSEMAILAELRQSPNLRAYAATLCATGMEAL